MGHAPEILNQWGKLEEVFFRSSTFTPEFLEQIRRALAFKNSCQYCMLKAGPPDENPESIRLGIALKFANKFAIDHASILKEEIIKFKQQLSDLQTFQQNFLGFLEENKELKKQIQNLTLEGKDAKDIKKYIEELDSYKQKYHENLKETENFLAVTGSYPEASNLPSTIRTQFPPVVL